MEDVPDIFAVLFHGLYERHQIAVEWNAKVAEMPAGLAAEKIDFVKSIDASKYFNGVMARLNNWRQKKNQVVFELSPTDYYTLLFSNQNVLKISRSWGDKHLSRALGISAVVVSKDERICFMKRNQHVGEFPGRYDVFGGHIDILDFDKKPDIFAAMEQELFEELNLASENYYLTLIGLIESIPNRKPELIFHAKSSKNYQELTRLAASALDGNEYAYIFNVMNQPEMLENFLFDNREDFSPSAYGSVTLYLYLYDLINGKGHSFEHENP